MRRCGHADVLHFRIVRVEHIRIAENSGCQLAQRMCVLRRRVQRIGCELHLSEHAAENNVVLRRPRWILTRIERVFNGEAQASACWPRAWDAPHGAKGLWAGSLLEEQHHVREMRKEARSQ